MQPHRRFVRFNRARRTVECERHRVPLGPPPLPVNVSSVRDVLPSVFKEFNLEGAWWERELVEKWPEVVGPAVAKVSRPGRYDRKTLTVFVSHSTWLSELKRGGERQILANIARQFGPDKVRQLRFLLDPGQP